MEDTKSIYITFAGKDFRRLVRAKKKSGKTWPGFISMLPDLMARCEELEKKMNGAGRISDEILNDMIQFRELLDYRSNEWKSDCYLDSKWRDRQQAFKEALESCENILRKIDLELINGSESVFELAPKEKKE